MKGGDFFWPPVGTFRGHQRRPQLATSGYFLMATDKTSGRGSHRVFTRAGVIELVNLQVEKGDAKLYQVRQVANLIRQYNLKLKEGR